MPPGCTPQLQGRGSLYLSVLGERGLTNLRLPSPAGLTAVNNCTVGRLQCDQGLETCSSNLGCQAKAVAACSQCLTVQRVHPRRSMKAAVATLVEGAR